MKATTRILLVCLFLYATAAGAQTIEQIEAYERRIDDQQQQLDVMREELEALKQLAGLQSTNDIARKQYEMPESTIDTDSDDAPFVLHRSESSVLSLSGRVHRVVMQVDDGASRNGFFMDSDQGPSVLRADASSQAANGWIISGALEVGMQSNRSFMVSQDNPNPGTDIQMREANVNIEHESFGKFSLGRGLSAALLYPEIDLSGTVPVALLNVGNLAPGMKFVDRSTNDLSSIQVLQHFVDTERLGLVDRFRYDSPTFGGGLQLSGTLAADERWDAAARYYTSGDNWTVRAATTYEHEPFRDVEDRITLGVSARHNATGLSLTAAIARGEATDGRKGTGYVVKGGWLTNLNKLGQTAFSLDFTTGNDAILDGDEAESFGFFALQKWNEIGLDLYGGFRRYEVKRPDIDLKPMNVLAVGAIYSF
jgi:hypothetical protein